MPVHSVTERYRNLGQGHLLDHLKPLQEQLEVIEVKIKAID